MSVTYTVPADLSGHPAVWCVEIGGETPTVRSSPRGGFVAGLHGGGFPGSPTPLLSPASPTYRFSDAGLVFEPTDADRPNQLFAARLSAPVRIEETIPVLPEAGSRGSTTLGRVVLANTDSRMDLVGGDWRIFGSRVTVLRGPRRQPTAAPSSAFETIATLRADSAAYGTDRLEIALRGSGLELNIPICGTYAGTGGAEGPPALAGRFKPRAYGRVLSMEPVLVNEGLAIFQVNDGPISGIIEARSGGALLNPSGQNFADYASLALATPPAGGTYHTCRAQGFIRFASVLNFVFTVDVLGDTSFGGYAGSAAAVASKILQGPGTVPFSRIGSGWSSWPTGEQGYLFQDGTVENALDRVAASCAGWWRNDAFGDFVAGRITAPEGLTASQTLSSLRAKARQIELAAPRWRQRVRHTVRQRPLTLAEQAATAANRDAQATAFQVATWFDGAISGPGSLDPEPLASFFTSAADAQALANQLGETFGRGREMWLLPLGEYSTVAVGDVVRVADPFLAPRLAGKNWIVRAVLRDGDRTDITVFG